MSTSPKTSVRRCSRARGVYVNVGGETRTQRMITGTRLRYSDAHRNPLHDLGEVSGGVVRRQQRELRSRCAADTLHLSFGDAAAVGVYLELHCLAWTNSGELSLLEVRRHPHASVGDNAEKRLSRGDELSD